MNHPGKLYVVGTPIGNLGDLSERARSVLAAVDLIAAEDTRRTRGLLSSMGLTRPVMAYHEHNEQARTPELLKRLQDGQSIALVSDAGTPLISDPGWQLVRAAQDHEIAVVSVPGPSALIAALSISGLATDRFVFEGFLPRRAAARAARLADLATEARTVVLYESVHRIEASLHALAEAFGGQRQAVIARELTKQHESVYSATLAELCGQLGTQIPLKGEFVVLVAGAEVQPDAAEAARVYALLCEHVEPDVAVRLAADITGLGRNEIYRLTRVRDP
jgi:16S rRNA (cytidine1402-2'-O)-methyltransferase